MKRNLGYISCTRGPPQPVVYREERQRAAATDWTDSRHVAQWVAMDACTLPWLNAGFAGQSCNKFLAYMLCKCGRPLALKAPSPCPLLSAFGLASVPRQCRRPLWMPLMAIDCKHYVKTCKMSFFSSIVWKYETLNMNSLTVVLKCNSPRPLSTSSLRLTEYFSTVCQAAGNLQKHKRARQHLQRQHVKDS